MIIPRWSTIGLFTLVVIHFIVTWLRAKKTGESLREAVLPAALLAVAVMIVFVRGFFDDLAIWIDAPILTLCSLIILFLVGLTVVRSWRYVTDSWRLEGEKDN
jgi:protein-S-isoprenylcysteine O-methyltransferase Ste14